jgi:hypothetical protein
MPIKRGEGRHGRPAYNQAQKVIAKFGGETKLAAATGVSRITAYRWQYARPYGADGLIPSSAVDKVQRAARLEGIILTDEDWRAERIDYEVAA